MYLPAVSVKLTIYLVYLFFRQFRATPRPDIEYGLAIGTTPYVRHHGVSRCPNGCYQGWHSDAIVVRS